MHVLSPYFRYNHRFVRRSPPSMCSFSTSLPRLSRSVRVFYVLCAVCSTLLQLQRARGLFRVSIQRTSVSILSQAIWSTFAACCTTLWRSCRETRERSSPSSRTMPHPFTSTCCRRRALRPPPPSTACPPAFPMRPLPPLSSPLPPACPARPPLLPLPPVRRRPLQTQLRMASHNPTRRRVIPVPVSVSSECSSSPTSMTSGRTPVLTFCALEFTFCVQIIICIMYCSVYYTVGHVT